MTFGGAVLSVSTTLIAVGFVRSIFPKTKLSKSLGFTLSLVLIATIIGALPSIEIPKIDLSVDETDSVNWQAFEAKQALSVFEQTVKTTLDACGVEYTSVVINTAESSGATEVLSVTVTALKRPSSETVKELEKKLSVKINIKAVQN